MGAIKRFAVKIRRRWHQISLLLNAIDRIAWSVVSWLLPLVSIVGGAIAMYDIGFNPFYSVQLQLWKLFHLMLVLAAILLALRMIMQGWRLNKKKHLIFNLILTLLFAFIASKKSLYQITAENTNAELIWAKGLQFGAMLLLAAIEISRLANVIYNRQLNPAKIFVGSFLFFIFSGTALLLLPRSTINGIQLVDAFFMATSAVCVTGLATVSLSDFTLVGQLIMLFLIQVGGLGVMTFAGLLGYAVAGKTSFKSQIALKTMVSSHAAGNVMQNVFTIIGVSLVFEGIGALLIYSSTGSHLFATQSDRIYFAIFHAISAFCNAGFSTLPNGLATQHFQHLYGMQWVIMGLIFLGSMGFPILFNLYRFGFEKLKGFYFRVLLKKPFRHVPKLLNLSSKLAMRTSLILLAVGSVSYFFFEQFYTLQSQNSLLGQVTTSVFGAVTTRTAGFQTVDFAGLSMPMVLLFFLLMWIGGSPASTSGGIKTTTAALAFLNMMAIIKGKSRTEIYGYQISHQSVRRSFAIVLLSLLIIGFCILGVSATDSDKGLIRIAFESISAFATVGLSMNITHLLSDSSKIIICITMFLGRVGALTLMVAFIKQSSTMGYRYPTEEVLI